MIKLIFTLYLFFISLHVFSQLKKLPVIEYKFTIETGDSIVKGTFSSKELNVKYNPQKFYYHFLHQQIHVTQGGGSGKPLHGKLEVFSTDLHLKQQGYMRYGLKDGLWSEWHDKGHLEKQVGFKKGVLHGKYREYDETGKLRSEGSYRNNVEQGFFINYDKNGNIINRIYYKNGKPVSKTIEKKSKIKKPTSPKKENKPVKLT